MFNNVSQCFLMFNTVLQTHLASSEVRARTLLNFSLWGRPPVNPPTLPAICKNNRVHSARPIKSNFQCAEQRLKFQLAGQQPFPPTEKNLQISLRNRSNKRIDHLSICNFSLRLAEQNQSSLFSRKVLRERLVAAISIISSKKIQNIFGAVKMMKTKARSSAGQEKYQLTDFRR